MPQFALPKFLYDNSALSKSAIPDDPPYFNLEAIYEATKLTQLGDYYASEILATGLREFDVVIGVGPHDQLLAHSVIGALSSKYRFHRKMAYYRDGEIIGVNFEKTKSYKSCIIVCLTLNRLVEPLITLIREQTKDSAYKHSTINDFEKTRTRSFAILGIYPAINKDSSTFLDVPVKPIGLQEDYDVVLKGMKQLPGLGLK